MDYSFHRNKLFWLFNLAFISLFTPVIVVTMRGYLGFMFFLIFILMVYLKEHSSKQVASSIRNNISRNKLLVFFIFLYFVGVILNQYYYMGLLDNWRLLMDRFVLLVGIIFAFGFAHDNNCRRYFLISYIIFMGIQAAFSTNLLYETNRIARDMWEQSSGAWIHGSQTFYADTAVIMPMLLGQSFMESGLLRLILIASCILIVIFISISTFATPVSLMILGAFIVIILSTLSYYQRKGKFISFIITGALICTVLLSYKYVFYRPAFFDASSRIENIIQDPKSGGYEENLSEGSRWYLAQVSIKSFFANPLLGVGGGSTRNNPELGGHSSFFDMLGAFGLLGGGGAFSVIVLIMLFNVTRRYWGERNWGNLLSLTSTILYVVVGIVNPYWEGAAMVLIMFMAHPFNSNNKVIL